MIKNKGLLTQKADFEYSKKKKEKLCIFII